MLPALPEPVLLAEMLAPFVKVTESPAAILMLPPFACEAVLLTLPVLLLNVLLELILTEPPDPAPVVPAVMSPPLFTCILFALTVIVPPVADAAAPDVAADNEPSFWSVTELASTKIFPPAPVPCVSVEMPLPEPSIRMD